MTKREIKCKHLLPVSECKECWPTFEAETSPPLEADKEALREKAGNVLDGYAFAKLRNKGAAVDEIMAAVDAYLESQKVQIETAARIDELERLQKLHTRTYRQTVTDNTGNVYVDDTHAYISKYETQERIAELQAVQKKKS